MRKSNNFSYIMMIVIISSSLIAIGIGILEELVGPANVFVGAICLLPVVFVWMLIADAIARKSDAKKRG